MIRSNIRAAAVVQIIAAILFSPVTFVSSVDAQSKESAAVHSENGLTTVTFNVRGGSVTVHLPEDMAAGDTITGTVIAEPTPLTNETSRGSDTLEGVVLDLGNGQQVPACQPCSALRTFVLPHVLEQKGPLGKISVMRPGASPITASVPVSASPPAAAIIDPSIPPFAQAGRPVPITGPFDGNAANTSCTIGGQSSPLLAESPRAAIFRTPQNLNGPTDVVLNERSRTTTGTIRVVQLKLSADKTALTRGERTNVHLEIKGLKGESRTVPLRLVTTGAANMQGGNSQTIEITPSAVGTDGTFVRDLALTGTTSGTFSVTGTVPIGNPVAGAKKCECFCVLNPNPIVTAGKRTIAGGAQHAFSPNVSKAACNGNQCSIAKTEYSWTVGAGSTAIYTITGGIADADTLSLDVTKKGTVELTVTITVKCSDGTSCSDTGSKTFTVDTK